MSEMQLTRGEVIELAAVARALPFDTDGSESVIDLHRNLGVLFIRIDGGPFEPLSPNQRGDE